MKNSDVLENLIVEDHTNSFSFDKLEDDAVLNKEKVINNNIGTNRHYPSQNSLDDIRLNVSQESEYNQVDFHSVFDFSNGL